MLGKLRDFINSKAKTCSVLVSLYFQKTLMSENKTIARYKDMFIRMLKTALTFVFYISLVIFVVFIVRNVDFGFLRGEVISYPVACRKTSDWEVYNTDAPNKQTAASNSNKSDPLGLFDDDFVPDSTLKAKDRVIYKPLVTIQQVISYTEDNNTLATYKNCSVKDINNWNCTLEDGTELGNINGKIFNSSDTNNTCNFLVTKSKWLDLKCRENQTDIKMKIICGISNLWEDSSKGLPTGNQSSGTVNNGKPVVEVLEEETAQELIDKYLPPK